MSVAVQRIGSPNFYSVPSGTGFSDDSINLLKNLTEQIRHLCEALTIGSSQEDTVTSLIELYKECSEANWDGYGANPVSKDAVFEASRFIELMPSSFPAPEVIAEPSGEIGLEWHKDKGLIFAISFSGNNMISYAGIFGANKSHGTEYFGDTIPPVIIENLKRLY